MANSAAVSPRSDPENPRSYVQYAENLGRRIAERIAAGETLSAICEDPDMPTRPTLRAWARKHPAFAEALAQAKARAHRPIQGGPMGYGPETADEILTRVAEGETLVAIAAEPDMPALSTILAWAADNRRFRDALTQAREAQAERLTEEGWRMALAGSPETARLLEVQLRQLRWMTGVRAPRTHRLKPGDPPPAPDANRPTNVAFKLFKTEYDPETGLLRSVSYVPSLQGGPPQLVRAGEWYRPRYPVVDPIPDHYPQHAKPIEDLTSGSGEAAATPLSRPGYDDDRWV